MAKLSTIYELCGGRCHLCGYRVPPPTDCRYGRQHALRATLDHVRPKSMGGGDAASNLRLAHRFCNHLRDRARLDSRTRVKIRALAAKQFSGDSRFAWNE